MSRFEESEEVVQDLQRLDVSRIAGSTSYALGDLVQWRYEWVGDSQFGSLYVVIGFDSENGSIVVTRAMGTPFEIREFHGSQLIKV